MSLPVVEKGKPSLWDQALRVVKGDNTTDLVEQFTQEMTLVAEGLCEDQARLRKAVDGLLRENQGQQEQYTREMEALAHAMDEQAQETQRQLRELSRRLEALERPKSGNKSVRALFSGDWLGRVTMLASIVCGTWLAVTLINALLTFVK